MGLLQRLGLGRETRRARAARDRELSGDLVAAVGLYLEANLPDEAARVLLLRADAERSPEKRMALCATAARTAADDDLKKRAAARKALIAYDMLVSGGTTGLKSEIGTVARDLEEAGELERAADAYAMAGDSEAEVRVLTAAGAIERLEERLRITDGAARDQRELERTLRTIADLDRVAERRAALELADAWLDRHDGERVADMARTIRARLARSAIVDLEIDGTASRFALGDDVTIGRGDATIIVASRAVSRRHVRIRRAGTGAVVEDLETRNGTLLAGARLGAPLPIGQGVSLLLGGEIPCAIRPAEADGTAGPWAIEVAGERVIAPLGELVVGPWRVGYERHGAQAFVALRTPHGAPRPCLGGYELSEHVELCVGDEVRAGRGAEVRLRVVRAARASDPTAAHAGQPFEDDP